MKAIEVITPSLRVLRERGNLIMKCGLDKSKIPTKKRLLRRFAPRDDSTNYEIAVLISCACNDRESSILQFLIYTLPK